MLKYMRAFLARFPIGSRRLDPDGCDRWQSDPLSHPVLRRMTPHQLADLPFNPWQVRRHP